MTIKLIKKPQDIQLIENGSWCWHNEIEEEVCDKIIMSADNFWQTGKIKNKQKENVISRQRSTDVHFNNENWIYDLVEPYMRKANKNAGWNYDISGMESYQIGKYSADISAHYDWHQDSLGTWNSINNTPNINLNGKTRKISMSLILNDDYEGGELEIWSSNKAAYKRGSIIFFPSWMTHRVTPVTKGTRYSLVVWFVGAPFK
jgi:PKHD-type hydroxylase